MRSIIVYACRFCRQNTINIVGQLDWFFFGRQGSFDYLLFFDLKIKTNTNLYESNKWENHWTNDSRIKFQFKYTSISWRVWLLVWAFFAETLLSFSFFILRYLVFQQFYKNICRQTYAPELCHFALTFFLFLEVSM